MREWYGNWVCFAFFGCWLLAVGLVELGSFRTMGDGRGTSGVVEKWSRGEEKGRSGEVIGFVSHNGGWFGRQDGGGTGIGFVSHFLAVGCWLLAVGLVGLGSFRIIAGWKLGSFRSATGGSPLRFDILVVGRAGIGQGDCILYIGGWRLGSFRHIWAWESGQDGGGAGNWVCFAFFGCWVLGFGSWPCGIGFVSVRHGRISASLRHLGRGPGWDWARGLYIVYWWVEIGFVSSATGGSPLRFDILVVGRAGIGFSSSLRFDATGVSHFSSSTGPPRGEIGFVSHNGGSGKPARRQRYREIGFVSHFLGCGGVSRTGRARVNHRMHACGPPAADKLQRSI